MANDTISDMETIQPPSKKIKSGSQQNGGYPSIREKIMKATRAGLNADDLHPLMIVGEKGKVPPARGAGGITVGAQSSGGANEAFVSPRHSMQQTALDRIRNSDPELDRETEKDRKISLLKQIRQKLSLKKPMNESKIEDKIRSHPAVEYYGGKDDHHMINLKPGYWHGELEQQSFSNRNASMTHKELKHIEKIPAGMEESVGKHNNVSNSKFDPVELAMGVKIEHEHTNDKDVAENIAKDHLSEIPDYYSRLVKLERNSKRSIKEAVDLAYNGSSDVERINYQLDCVFKNKFANPYLIVTAVNAVLERFGINMPAMTPSGRNESYVYHIHGGTTDLYLYVCIERDEQGHYDAFAQVVDKHGLSALIHKEHEHDEHEEETLPEYPSHFILQARHSADD